METYYLNGWKITAENKSKSAYEFVYDEKDLMILDKFQDCVSFVEVNQKGNLVLQKLSSSLRYQVNRAEKCLNIMAVDG
mgnify:FL=1